jgi:hypothetical protein
MCDLRHCVSYSRSVLGLKPVSYLCLNNGVLQLLVPEAGRLALVIPCGSNRSD